jgi:hypothetical protein
MLAKTCQAYTKEARTLGGIVFSNKKTLIHIDSVILDGAMEISLAFMHQKTKRIEITT